MKRHPHIDYGPGYFSALVVLHDWPPGFRASQGDGKRSHIEVRDAAVKARNTALAKGITGTILGGLSPKSERLYSTGDVAKTAVKR